MGPQCPDVQSACYFKAGPGGNPASIPNYTICRLGSNPHSRGVYRAATAPALRTTGSSPLARGLHRRNPLWTSSAGIIPARAGFTRHHHRGARRRADHPRSRGVYIRRASRRITASGASPLARGLRQHAVPVGRTPRIIPARAGFMTTIFCTPGGWGGSSPLARGLREGTGEREGSKGIIPARAGFTPNRKEPK